MISTTVSKPIAKGMVETLKRAKLKREQLLEVYVKALTLAEEKERWSNGESTWLYNGTLHGLKAGVFIRNDSGRLNLYLYSEHSSGRLDKRFYSRPFLVGMYMPNEGGWKVVRQDSKAYLDWNRAVNIVCHQKTK